MKAKLVALLLIAMLLTGCGPAPAPKVEPTATPVAQEAAVEGADLDKLIEDAKKEGSVVVYSFTSRIATVEKAFEAAYPEIDLVSADMSSTEMITRLVAENNAGSAKADVVYVSDAPPVYTQLVQNGILENFMPPQFADRIPAAYQTPLLSNRISTKVLMYNEESNPDGSPITNLWQLVEPEWKSRVIMVDPSVRGDYLDLMTEIVLQSDAMAKAYETLHGKPIELEEGVENAGYQFIKSLMENDVIMVSSTDDVNAAIGVKGQTNPPVGFTSYSDRRDNEDEGWALQIANDVEPASGISFPAMLALVKGAEHPNAARLLIHFMMGDDSETGGEAYKPFYVPGDYATRTDITPHPDAVPLADLNAWYIDPVKSSEIRATVADFILGLN